MGSTRPSHTCGQRWPSGGGLGVYIKKKQGISYKQLFHVFDVCRTNLRTCFLQLCRRRISFCVHVAAICKRVSPSANMSQSASVSPQSLSAWSQSANMSSQSAKNLRTCRPNLRRAGMVAIHGVCVRYLYVLCVLNIESSWAEGMWKWKVISKYPGRTSNQEADC